jgi:spore coat polysaccharide biosynthesis protein SpsF
MENSICLIAQARIGSQRLPGKSVISLGQTNIIETIFSRLNILDVSKWLATSSLPEDDVLAKTALRYGWKVHRGDDEDVLSRFVDVLSEEKAKTCLRVTGDNPLVCPVGLKRMIEKFHLMRDESDYMSDFDFGHFPTGAFAEVFSVPKFLTGIKHIPKSEPWHHAHVTSWMRKSTRVSSLLLPNDFLRRPNWRWTVDYAEDLQFIKQLIEKLGDSWIEFSYPEIVKVIDRNPDLVRINYGMKQKSIELG